MYIVYITDIFKERKKMNISAFKEYENICSDFKDAISTFLQKPGAERANVSSQVVLKHQRDFS